MTNAPVEVACLDFPAGLDAVALRALGEACLGFSSQVALRQDESVFVETGRSRLLYGTAGLRARLSALGRRFRTAPSMGWGSHAGEALAFARHAGGDKNPSLGSLPLEALHCYGAPFSFDEEIAAHIEGMIGALRRLGVRDLGGFTALPAGGWGERFGPNAAVLRERLEGRLLSAWPRFEPAPRLEEAQDLRDVEAQSVGATDEALRFHLKNLCDRVAARLRGRGLRAAGLALTLRFERVRGLLDLAPWVLAVPLALPVAEPSELRKLLQERLEAEARRRPLPRNLEALGLEVTATAPGFSPQRDAFDRREEEVEARDGLLNRLTQRLGGGQVFYAELEQKHLPDRAWKRSPHPPEKDGAESVPRVARPPRLLRKPLLLARAEEWLLYWGGGGKSRRWRALDWQGPERIGPEWWRPDAGLEAPERDYWRVATEGGMDLWLYCRPGDEARGGALWLQGWWG